MSSKSVSRLKFVALTGSRPDHIGGDILRRMNEYCPIWRSGSTIRRLVFWVLGNMFGEIRWFAAYALAAERAALGINEPIQVRVVKLAQTMDILAAEYEAKIDGEGGEEGLLESLAILRDMGYMPMEELNIWPLAEPYPNTIIIGSRETRMPELVPA